MVGLDNNSSWFNNLHNPNHLQIPTLLGHLPHPLLLLLLFLRRLLLLNLSFLECGMIANLPHLQEVLTYQLLLLRHLQSQRIKNPNLLHL